MNHDLSAEYRLSTSALPLVNLAKGAPETTFTLNEILRTDDQRAVLLVWIETPRFEEMETALSSSSLISSWSTLATTENRRLYRLQIIATDDVQIPVETEFIERGVTPIDATITDRGWLVRAHFPDRTTLVDYRNACERRGLSFSLERLYEPTRNDTGEKSTLRGLTPKQREALVLAYTGGYYDLPRKTKLTDLSHRLDISQRSLSDRLRRAERHLVETAVTNERLYSDS